VAFIPTAGDVYENPSFVEEDYTKLQELGYNVKIIRLQGKKIDTLRSELHGCTVIFVAGGNTFYLLQEAKKSGFDTLVIDFVKKGGTYIGSSAGSVLVGKSVELVKSLDDPTQAPELVSYDGIGLIPEVVLPHAGNPKYAEKYHKILATYGKKYKIIQLTDTQVYVVDGKSKPRILQPEL
jgi:dipeptidase E